MLKHHLAAGSSILNLSFICRPGFQSLHWFCKKVYTHHGSKYLWVRCHQLKFAWVILWIVNAHVCVALCILFQGIGTRLPATIQLGPFGTLGASEPANSQYVQANRGCVMDDPDRMAGYLHAAQLNDTMVAWADNPPRIIVRVPIFLGAGGVKQYTYSAYNVTLSHTTTNLKISYKRHLWISCRKVFSSWSYLSTSGFLTYVCTWIGA